MAMGICYFMLFMVIECYWMILNEGRAQANSENKWAEESRADFNDFISILMGWPSISRVSQGTQRFQIGNFSEHIISEKNHVISRTARYIYIDSILVLQYMQVFCAVFCCFRHESLEKKVTFWEPSEKFRERFPAVGFVKSLSVI